MQNKLTVGGNQINHGKNTTKDGEKNFFSFLLLIRISQIGKGGGANQYVMYINDTHLTPLCSRRTK